MSFQDDDGNSETATSDTTGPVSAEANESATGQPTISGTAQVGEDLSASVSGISDGNGWRFDLQLPVAACRDGERGGGGHLRSEERDLHSGGGGPGQVRACAGELPGRRRERGDGDQRRVGTGIGGAERGGDGPADDQRDGAGRRRTDRWHERDQRRERPDDGPSYSYQWLRGETAAAAGSEIAGGTSATYRLVEADQGKYVRVQVSFQDDDGNAETATSDATGPVSAEANVAATGQPTISGKAQVGENLSAGSGISDGNGLASPTYSYQWLRAETADAAGEDISTGRARPTQWWRRTRASTSECR